MHHQAMKFEFSNTKGTAYDVYYNVLEKEPHKDRFVKGGAIISHESPIHTSDGPMDLLLLDEDYCKMTDVNSFSHSTVLAVVDKDANKLRHLDASVTNCYAPDVAPTERRYLLVDSVNVDLLNRSSVFNHPNVNKHPVCTFDRIDIDLGDNRFILLYQYECLGPYRNDQPHTYVIYMPMPDALKNGDEIYSIAFGKDITENITIVDVSNTTILRGKSLGKNNNEFLRVTIKLEG